MLQGENAAECLFLSALLPIFKYLRCVYFLLASSHRSGFYGKAGEFCEPCPAGASCVGEESEPVALLGFYIGYKDVLDTRNDPCPTGHNNRTRYEHPVIRTTDPYYRFVLAGLLLILYKHELLPQQTGCLYVF